MLSNLRLTDLLDAFSSPDPTPGGGSAAALMGALGVSLLAMVAALPKTKTGAPGERAALDAARVDLLRLRKALVDLVDRDAAAYDLVVAAFKKPKDTNEEKAARSAAIQDAMRIATETPVDTFRACADAMEGARVVAEHGNPSAKSDVAVAVHALQAALMGAAFNVEINIGSLKDTALVDRLTASLREAQSRVTASLPQIHVAAGIVDLMKLVGARLGGHGRFPED
jgi:formiminotetrahydrofolate cyclodeaminase